MGQNDAFGPSRLGCCPGSPLGVVFRGYVEVLLEPGLIGAVVEVPELLVEGIRRVVVGPEVLSRDALDGAGGEGEGGLKVEGKGF